MDTNNAELSCQIVYIAGLARIFGKTECSIREGVKSGVDWLPESRKIAGKHAWRMSDVSAFLDQLYSPEGAAGGRKKIGRPRKAPPVFQS